VNDRLSRRWLAIRWIDLPLSALGIDEAFAIPTVVAEKKKVIYANNLATKAGAHETMDATTAQLLTGCRVVERDAVKEQEILDVLSEQLYQFTPHITRFCSDESADTGLLPEISSCLRLFGGLKNMVDAITALLTPMGHGFKFGLAHSEKAAWYLSFIGYAVTGDESEALFFERINTLPVELLFDYPKAMDALIRTGFRCFGDIARQINGNSLSSFRKRFGQDFIDMLCDIFDIDQHFQQNSLFQKPRESYTPKEWFEEEIQFEYPVTLVEHLKPAIESLLQQLSDYLRKRQQECQHIEWTILDIYRHKEFFTVGSDTPQSHWQLLYDLTLIQFENTELPFEVDVIKLCCRYSLSLQNRIQVLDFEQARRRRTSVSDFAVTIAKLKARLGDDAVYKLSYCDDRVPELTNTTLTLAEKSNQRLPDIFKKSLRPSWLLTPPEKLEERNQRLFWRGYIFPIVGPERIIGNWWDQPVARDYYLAKRHDNTHLWIYFNLYDKSWYVHGVFS
jgi:protein ImuB